MSGTIKVYQISEVRTSVVKGEPGEVILTISAGGERHYYGLHVEDLAGMAKQLQADVLLLKS